MAEQKLSDVFPEPKVVTIGRWQVPIRRLTLADWAAAEQHFGSLDTFMEAFNGKAVMTATQFVIWRLVRKVDPTASIEEVGEAIDDLDEAIKMVNEVLMMSVPEAWRGKAEGGGETNGGS
ncbi:MAG: hypothetical protein SLRJCFUN_001764 [Candidatus Fervidibacter sp.]